MQIKFQLAACDACKKAQAPHATLDGTVYSHQDIAEKKPPRLPEDGCCKFTPVGACHFCGIDAKDLGIAATCSVDVTRKLTNEKTGEEKIHTLSFCANCALYLAQAFFQLAQQGTLGAIREAVAPKIVHPGRGLVVPIQSGGRLKN